MGVNKTEKVSIWRSFPANGRSPIKNNNSNKPTTRIEGFTTRPTAVVLEGDGGSIFKAKHYTVCGRWEDGVRRQGSMTPKGGI